MIAYMTLGTNDMDRSIAFYDAVFGAIGAAVTEMREAQALVTPVMLVLMVPWLLVAPVARDPNTTMAIALSFIPPVNTLAMMIRMASTSPERSGTGRFPCGSRRRTSCASRASSSRSGS